MPKKSANDLRPFADSVDTDTMGNLIVLKKGKSSEKKLMLAAHMDEIGFVVTYIEESGFLRVSNIGGINAVASAYHKVIFENGTVGVLVVESGTAFGDVAVKKMYVDIGAKNKKEAERKVKIGDCLSVAPELIKLGSNRYAAKAFDDRLACALLAEVAAPAKSRLTTPTSSSPYRRRSAAAARSRRPTPSRRTTPSR